jgi:hypothetical protein
VRRAFVHDGVAAMESGGDVREPPSRSHFAATGSTRRPVRSHRIAPTRSAPATKYDCALFAAEPAAEAEVRCRIEVALSQASLTWPDGVATRWQLRGERESKS